jgi:hypothetical protein
MLHRPQGQSSPPNGSRLSESKMKNMLITQEMVRAVADRVYAMLLHELKVDRERERFRSRLPRS